MVVEVRRQICDGNMLKWLVGAGLAWLTHHQDTVNHLNVFPVPDGDTGTNMRLTMQKAYDAVRNLDETHVGIISETVARGALYGARGNSGVILSQLLHGFSTALRGHEVFDTGLFAYATQKGVDAAYQAVITPVEGTILTVAREAAQAGSAYAEGGSDLTEMLESMIHAGQAALNKTPELLPILKKAGVVDSGGQGLLFILEGMARLLRGEPVEFERVGKPDADPRQWQDALEPDDEAGYGYDVQFLMRGENINVAQVRADIDAMGWSTLVVGDESLIKVHVHVHDPGQPLSYAIRSGAAIDDIVVENMQKQYEDYVAKRTTDDHHHHSDDAESEVEGVAVIAVISGDGLSYLFKHDLGAAAIINGGQTMNPSTEEFLNQIKVLANTEILLLPNNKNVQLAAEQAARLAQETSAKRVRVVPSISLPQGIGAMVAYTGLRDTAGLDELFDEMTAAMEEIVTGEVTYATHAVQFDAMRAEANQPIGLLDDRLVTSGDTVEAVVQTLLEKAGADERELITLYYGDTIQPKAAEMLAETLRHRFVAQEVQIVYGGQPLYPYIISIE